MSAKIRKVYVLSHFWSKLWYFKPNPVVEYWGALFINYCLGFLLVILSLQAFLIIVFVYLCFYNLGSKLFLEDAPLALRPSFGPSVGFWVRLPLLKIQAHVAIALGTTCGINTKTPLTLPNGIWWRQIWYEFHFRWLFYGEVVLFAWAGMYNNLAPLDRTSYLLITFFLALYVLLDALLFFVTHMGSMLYIPFRSGQNGRKISYRMQTSTRHPHVPPRPKFRLVSVCFGRFGRYM